MPVPVRGVSPFGSWFVTRVDGKGAVGAAMGLVPGPQGDIELDGVDADQEAAHRRRARRAVLAVAALRERQHRRERVAPPLPAAGVVDVVEGCGKGSHLCGAEHHLRHSVSQREVEIVREQLGPHGPRQGMNEHPLGKHVFAVAVASPLEAEAAVLRPTSIRLAAR